MDHQQQAPQTPPMEKHDLCQMTRQELMSPVSPGEPLSAGDACPCCSVLDGRFAPVGVHPSAPAAPAGNKIN